MKLTDFARHLPEEVWPLFEPLLPPVVWCGNGRPPASTSDGLPAVFSVLVSGMAWRMLPKGFPSSTTVQRRLQVWLQCATLRPAWPPLAHRYAAVQGINWEQLLRDGSQKPSKKGAHRQARVPSVAASAARLSPSPVPPGPGRWGPS
jgi:transposase